MPNLNITEKVVAANASWTSLKLGADDATGPQVYKVTFDRTYPYFWVWAISGGSAAGLALTRADVERAAQYDETGQLTGFDLNADGVMPFYGNMAFCIAMGHRKSFYVLWNGSASSSWPVCISAQDDAVCPFMAASPWQ